MINHINIIQVLHFNISDFLKICPTHYGCGGQRYYRNEKNPPLGGDSKLVNFRINIIK